jgi:hypothetical protein
MLIKESIVHSNRYGAVASDPRLFHAASTVDLGQLRSAYEQDRRRDIIATRSATGSHVKRTHEVKDGQLEGLGWTMAEEVSLQEEVEDVWPEWWGNPDVVGPSPFDHVPQIEGQRRILFLTG